MSKIKGHTPGPWRYAETSGRDGGQLTPESVTVFSLSDAELAPCRAYGDTLEQMWANARLIAAAPELYAALDYLVRARDKGWKIDETGWDHARAAIARATGKGE